MLKEENKLKLATYIERKKMLRVTIIKEEKEWNLYLISWKLKIENIDIFMKIPLEHSALAAQSLCSSGPSSHMDKED